MTTRVLFYVQHLLGIGHLKRAATLARAMHARGANVTVVSGGMPLDILDTGGFDLVQLPPLRAADRSFQELVDADDKPLDDALLAKRRARLLAALAETQPDVVIVELFPFGRRKLAGEIVPLLEAARAARPRPRVLSSVRDILVEKGRPDVDAEMAGAARKYFDAVLVHGDPSFIPFGETFSCAADIADLIRHTGYVVEAPTVARRVGGEEGEVVVSAGSGAIGAHLLQTALAARPLSLLAQRRWHLLAGPSLPEDAFADLRRAAPAGMVVERARADFADLLQRAALSISQGGYNTVMEALACGIRAVVVPYGGGHETEQTLRARRLAERGLLEQVPESELTPATLAAAIGRALATSHPAALTLELDGAARTAEFVVSHRARAAQ